MIRTSVVVSGRTIRGLLGDLEDFVFSGGGAYFCRCIKAPSRLKIALCKALHNALNSYYRRSPGVQRSRCWICPVCMGKEMGTRYFSKFPGGVSWCQGHHFWDNKTGKHLVPPDDVTYQIFGLAESFERDFVASALFRQKAARKKGDVSELSRTH